MIPKTGRESKRKIRKNRTLFPQRFVLNAAGPAAQSSFVSAL